MSTVTKELHISAEYFHVVCVCLLYLQKSQCTWSALAGGFISSSWVHTQMIKDCSVIVSVLGTER